MSNEQMPATEAAHYELAFHVLPTVAEGEVAVVFQKIKDIITKAGGTVTAEEAPARFELAYSIVKYLEGRNRKFSSAYFGWVRFELEPSKLEKVSDAVEGTNELLRHLLIRLNKLEAEYPFNFHEALASDEKKIETVDLDEADTAGEDEADVEKKDDDDDTDSEDKEDKVE